MPNNVRNRLEMIGTKKEIQKIVNKFSTPFLKEINKTYDNSLIVCKNSKNQFIGWYNDVDDIFIYSLDNKKVKGLPKGIKYEYNEAWTRFPDFDKIFKMPKCLKGLEPHNGIVTAVKKKYEASISGNPLLASLEMLNRQRQTMEFKDEEKELFDKCCKAYEEIGFIYWYDWRVSNWGTKWNAYACEKENENTFIFDTAWSSVKKIIKEISTQFPNIQFIYEWSDEDTGNNCGSISYFKGKSMGATIENGSVEAFELAFKLRPEYREDYKLVNGNYKYIDEE